MSDKDYIDEIKKENKKMLHTLYETYRSKFFSYFANSFKISQDDIADIYQDCWTSVYLNIRNERLTSQNLNVKLETYLFQVGKYILYARNRKTKNIFNTDVNVLDKLNLQGEDLDLEESHVQVVEREDCAMKAVQNIGEPCSSILLKFYIEQKSGEQIALELHYKDASSIKTQKYKCMQKLKSLVDTQLSKINLT